MQQLFVQFSASMCGRVSSNVKYRHRQTAAEMQMWAESCCAVSSADWVWGKAALFSSWSPHPLCFHSDTLWMSKSCVKPACQSQDGRVCLCVAGRVYCETRGSVWTAMCDRKRGRDLELSEKENERSSYRKRGTKIRSPESKGDSERELVLRSGSGWAGFTGSDTLFLCPSPPPPPLCPLQGIMKNW